MRKVALASFIGSAIEYYDFYIYGMAAALVFPHVFFPDLSPTLATVSSFATFAVAFLVRPIGSAFFGHYGDRLGRKKTLIATLLIMGLSTTAIGLVPSASTIGAAAPLALILLRALQGFAVGGEWSGAVLLTAEYAPDRDRGRFGMYPQVGVGTGLVLSSLVFLAVSTAVGTASTALLDWAWRIPFLLSIFLVAVALYMRLNIAETPVFRARETEVPRSPLRELLRAQSGRTLLAAGSMISIFTFTFIGGTYLTGYGRTVLGHSFQLVLIANLAAGIAMVLACAGSAILSDSLGRRTVILVGLVIGVPWAFAILPILNTGSPHLFVLGIAGTFLVLGITYGPMASFVPELFATRYRYTGAGLAYNLAGVLGGAIPPVIAGALLAAFGSLAVALLLIGSVITSLVSTLLLPETRASRL
ncbi:MFS transporter [Tsukamurella tyrosinosolvens]|nr:MFS transporter [Tsukamurella tyrosinosolvens]MEC4612989.1 MFS transporter [Tsukamurella tyrosinosolvens]